MRRPKGGYYPAPGSGQEALDAESMRKVPGSRSLIWSSEGDARDGFGPAIRTTSFHGHSSAALALPPVFRFDLARTKGPRANLSFEGLSFEPSGQSLWVSLEAPLIEDGAPAGPETGAIVRLSRLSYPSLVLTAQFAYNVEAIGPVPANRLADNGVSEIVALDSRRLLVLERSGIQQQDGEFTYRSRLYCADLSSSQDVTEISSLRGQPLRLAAKRLVLDFRSIPSPRIDNVEGMTLGPMLSNGNQTIVFVTDNDFSARRDSQVIAFEIVPERKGATIAETLCAHSSAD